MPDLPTPRQRWAKVLKAGRKKRNLTRPQLARALGVSEATIRAVENGYRSPSCEMLTKFVLYLHVDPSALFYDDDLIS